MSLQCFFSQVAAEDIMLYFFSSFLHWCIVFYSTAPSPFKNERISSAPIADYTGFWFVWQGILPIFSPLLLSCHLSARSFCLDPYSIQITWIIYCSKMLIFFISSNGYTILYGYAFLLVALFDFFMLLFVFMEKKIYL